ncbi:hypothetical protein [Granulicella sibirica]|uniref:hypothetical protein n=1 Tax=Granulicella sibirica TaxID=2479048 RepID=UPI00100921F8|nr:hypothetical protein [Granulicella sibirica]
MKRRILNYGHDKSLLDIRGELVRSAGFDVLCAYTREEVEKLIEAGPADALILCHTVSAQEDEALLLKVKMLPHGIKTLVLNANKHDGFISGDVPTVDVWNGPDALLKALRTLVAIP